MDTLMPPRLGGYTIPGLEQKRVIEQSDDGDHRVALVLIRRPVANAAGGRTRPGGVCDGAATLAAVTSLHFRASREATRPARRSMRTPLTTAAPAACTTVVLRGRKDEQCA
jgi:hypothetical protein